MLNSSKNNTAIAAVALVATPAPVAASKKCGQHAIFGVSTSLQLW